MTDSSTDTSETDIRTLLDNRVSRIVVQGPDELICSTSDRIGALVFLVAGIACLYISIVLFVWKLRDGEIHPPSLIAGLLIFVFGIYLQSVALKRNRQTGTYLIDKSAREVRNALRSRRVSFDSIRYIRLVADPLEVVRLDLLPELPMWLAIEFREGTRIYIGKGRRKELVPVLNWLVTSGLPYAS